MQLQSARLQVCVVIAAEVDKQTKKMPSRANREMIIGINSLAERLELGAGTEQGPKQRFIDPAKCTRIDPTFFQTQSHFALYILPFLRSPALRRSFPDHPCKQLVVWRSRTGGSVLHIGIFINYHIYINIYINICCV